MFKKPLSDVFLYVIGSKDFASRYCIESIHKTIPTSNTFEIDSIDQQETKAFIQGHHFDQRDYQKRIYERTKEHLKIYEIY
jgi:hypothetical protein